MKNSITLLIFICSIQLTAVAQNIGINATGASPNASAILDVSSTSKGLLMPRMTTVQRNAIAAPAEGLKVYDTDTKTFWFYNGTAWSQISVGSNGWNLTGNAGTNPAANFIGTTDAQPLRFRVNNLWAGEIHPTNGNLFFGLGAGQSNTTGYSNNANGYLSLSLNSTGVNNTASGSEALKVNTIGYNNTAHGSRALLFNTTGNNNTATGEQALTSNSTGDNNTANGRAALGSNTTGLGNTATGEEALFNNSTGYNNTAVGNLALLANTTGWDNTGIGVTALFTNTTGVENTATGRQSLFFNTTGFDNTATGYKALRSNSIGVFNSANGAYALYSNTTGQGNTASGHRALYDNTTGYDNTALGYTANVSTGDLQNATAIGYNAVADASNKVRVGNIDVTSIGGQVGWTSFSDGRYKKNIKEDVKGLLFINSLRPITYTVDISGLNAYYDKGRKYDSAYIKAKASMKSSAAEAAKIVNNGFIAQDVEKAAQSIGYNFSGVDKPQTKDGLYGLRYADFVVPLVKAVQEQQAIITSQQKQIDLLEKRLAALETKK